MTYHARVLQQHSSRKLIQKISKNISAFTEWYSLQTFQAKLPRVINQNAFIRIKTLETAVDRAFAYVYNLTGTQFFNGTLLINAVKCKHWINLGFRYPIVYVYFKQSMKSKQVLQWKAFQNKYFILYHFMLHIQHLHCQYISIHLCIVTSTMSTVLLRKS